MLLIPPVDFYTKKLGAGLCTHYLTNQKIPIVGYFLGMGIPIFYLPIQIQVWVIPNTQLPKLSPQLGNKWVLALIACRALASPPSTVIDR